MRAYLYVCYREEKSGEIYALVGRGKPYHYDGLARLKNDLEGEQHHLHKLSYFGTKNDIYGYKEEKKLNNNTISSDDPLPKLQSHIKALANGHFRSTFQHNGHIYGKTFGGAVNNTWVTFPGGKKDDRDHDAKVTAIREFMEEAGLVLYASDHTNYPGYDTPDKNSMRKNFYKKAHAGMRCFHQAGSIPNQNQFAAQTT